jgi:hypothetical protein
MVPNKKDFKSNNVISMKCVAFFYSAFPRIIYTVTNTTNIVIYLNYLQNLHYLQQKASFVLIVRRKSHSSNRGPVCRRSGSKYRVQNFDNVVQVCMQPAMGGLLLCPNNVLLLKVSYFKLFWAYLFGIDLTEFD